MITQTAIYTILLTYLVIAIGAFNAIRKARHNGELRDNHKNKRKHGNKKRF